MQVMEAREAVEEADSPARLSHLLAENRAREEGLVAELASAFQSGQLDAAAELAVQLTYIMRIQEAIKAKM